MEILIVGLIVVALMVYASTRIKRDAAAAFEAEVIETDDYVIQKPEGFLHNLNSDPQYVFEAYSKEFSEEYPKMRQGRVTITRAENDSLEDAVGDLAAEGAVPRQNESIDARSFRILDKIIENDESRAFATYKLAANGTGVYMLEAVSTEEERPAWLETFVESFRVK